MKWKKELIKHLKRELYKDSRWSAIAEKISEDSSVGVHLAIFNEPFLSLIFTGQKKIESRFSINMISPYRKVAEGDIIVLKESGGMIVGVFLAGNVMYFSNPDKKGFEKLKSEYGDLIGSNYDKDFWKKRQNTRYVTLIEVKKVKKLIPFASEKNDRLGWSVVIKNESVNLFNYAN
jgi:ASC-1-like (ASCH) protein